MSTALDVALAYHQAWTSGDFEAAMAYIAPDVVCDAPAGRLSGAEAFRAFMGPFAGMLLRSQLIAAFGEDERAVVVYDTATPPVPSGPASECVTVRDGKIVHNRFIFDRLPFEQARTAVAAE
jgi:ketosteroid isomerase-like protein